MRENGLPYEIKISFATRASSLGSLQFITYDILSSNKEKIGYITTTIVPKGCHLDSIISDLSDHGNYCCADFIELSKEDIELENSILNKGLIFLDELFIIPYFRGHGHGESSIILLMDRLKDKKELLALQACPEIDGVAYEKIQDPSERIRVTQEDTLKLKSWYATWGFKDFSFSDYMFR